MAARMTSPRIFDKAESKERRHRQASARSWALQRLAEENYERYRDLYLKRCEELDLL